MGRAGLRIYQSTAAQDGAWTRWHPGGAATIFLADAGERVSRSALGGRWKCGDARTAGPAPAGRQMGRVAGDGRVRDRGRKNPLLARLFRCRDHPVGMADRIILRQAAHFGAMRFQASAISASIWRADISTSTLSGLIAALMRRLASR